jgi:ABC-2 type transport system permease protein
MISALGRTEGATRGIAIFTVLILVMLGGAWVPSFLFPEWLQHASEFVPTRWAVDGFDAMTWRGLPLQSAFAPTVILIGWSALFALIAIWRFNWDDD